MYEPCVMCVQPMATGLPSLLMLIRRAAAFAKMRTKCFPLDVSVECRAFVSERILVGLRWHSEGR